MDLKHDSEGGENDTSILNSNSLQSFKRPSGTKTSSPSQSGQRRSSSRERFSDVRTIMILFYDFAMYNIICILFYRQVAIVVQAEGIL